MHGDVVGTHTVQHCAHMLEFKPKAFYSLNYSYQSTTVPRIYYYTRIEYTFEFVCEILRFPKEVGKVCSNVRSGGALGVQVRAHEFHLRQRALRF